MAWSTPLTAVSNASLTASQWNASVRDNLNATAVAIASAANQVIVTTGVNALAARTPSVASAVTGVETTASTTYTSALTTPGPAVTVTTGLKAMVMVNAICRCGTPGVAAHASFAVSGASSAAAADENGAYHMASTANYSCRLGATTIISLTAGSNTFTMNYKSGAAGTSGFDARTIVVFPL
jgi:hypothetical protein